MEMPDEFTVVLFRGSGFSCFRHSSFGAQTLTPLADDSLASIPFCMRYPFEFIDQGLIACLCSIYFEGGDLQIL